jgi:Domain of unknown function (DUF4907)
MLKMINKKTLYGLTLLIMLVVFGSVLNKRDHHYTVDVINSEQGWGYNILYNNKLIIHQPYMPAKNGQFAFQNKYDAKKTGQLVVKKLQNCQSPRVRIDELDSIIKSSDKVTYQQKDN